MFPARALHIDEDITYGYNPDRIISAPTVRTDDPLGFPTLPTLLMRLGRLAHSHGLAEMTVMVGQLAAKRLGLPDHPPQRSAAEHPVAVLARQHGWLISMVSPWMTFYRADGGPSVHIGVEPWLTPKTFRFLVPDDPAATVYRLGRFQELTGAAFHARAGIAGGEILKRIHKGPKPLWSPRWEGVEPAGEVVETAFGEWTPAKTPAGEWVHSYDCNRQYLAAAGNAELAVGRLRHTGPVPFDKRVAGFWKVEVPVWNMADVSPHPFGDWAAECIGQQVWVTTPTLAFVHELSTKWGIITPPAPVESWTADNEKKGTTRRILRDWATHIDTCIRRAADEPITDDAAVMVDTVKRVYKESVGGLWVNEQSRIHRPDWVYTIRGLARVNHHRRIMTAGMELNRWPVYIKADRVDYASNNPAPVQAVPASYPIHDNLGGWKVLKSVKAAM